MDQILDLLAQNSVDACLLTSPANIRYVTGFTGDDATALVSPHGKTLITDSRYEQQARDETMDTETEVHVIRAGQDRWMILRDFFTEHPAAVLGIEEEALSVSEYRHVQSVAGSTDYADFSNILLQERAIKTEHEIACIQEAARATDRVMEALLDVIHPGMSEYEIRAELLYAIAREDMDLAFEPIVAAGPNGAMPHASVSQYRLRKGDFITLDFGCRYLGYCADMTRTIAVGHVDDELKTIYDIVEKAQEAAENAAEVGVTARQVDEIARTIIRDAGYARYFGHGTGHGVGLQIHELPIINQSSDAILVDGMAFTIEPGIYVEGLGGVRIEDTCVAGIGSLFSFPKTLIELH